jgi:hypothetical protein
MAPTKGTKKLEDIRYLYDHFFSSDQNKKKTGQSVYWVSYFGPNYEPFDS